MEPSKVNTSFLAGLKKILINAGYTEKAFLKAGMSVVNRYSPRYKFVLDKLTASKPIAYELIKLFFFGDGVEIKSLGKYFTKTIIKQFIDSGLLREKENNIYSEFKIIPYLGHYFLSDFVTKYEGGNQKGDDLVFPISRDSADLVDAAVRTKSKNTLDPTTGCGVHAIVQSKYSRYVLGVDINPRAIEIAKMNALINNVRNVEFRVGDLYKEATGMKFDQILSNPPYETSAHTRLTLGNGGELGRDALGVIVGGLPEFLTDKGICQIVAKMFLKDNETVGTLIKGFLGKTPFKILYQDISSSDIFQDAYSRYDNVEDLGKYKTKVEALLERYKKNGVSRIAYGIVSLKKSQRFSYVEKKYSNVYVLPLTPHQAVKNYFG